MTNTQNQGNSNTSNNNNNNAEQYPSAETLLAVIQKEYDYEAGRKRDLETRTGILIALIGALIGFYMQQIDFSLFKQAETPIEILCFIIISLIFLFPIITFFLSLKYFISVLKTKEYQRLGLGGFSENIASKKKDYISLKLAESYKTVVEKNGISNDEKAMEFKKGINNLFISIAGIIAAYIIKEVILLIL